MEAVSSPASAAGLRSTLKRGYTLASSIISGSSVVRIIFWNNLLDIAAFNDYWNIGIPPNIRLFFPGRRLLPERAGITAIFSNFGA